MVVVEIIVLNNFDQRVNFLSIFPHFHKFNINIRDESIFPL